MTPAQEEMALRSCHPLYREWCEDDDINLTEEEGDENEATNI